MTRKPHFPRVVFKLPYIGNPSLHTEKELKLFFKKKQQMKLIRFTTVHMITNKVKNFSKNKDRQPLLMDSDVVYP